MSTTSVSPSQTLRIAIALAALKFRPPQLSIQTYILELRYYFCRSAIRSTSEQCDPWRKRSHELEAELRASRASATADDAGHLVTKPAPPPPEGDVTGHRPSASKRRSKKTKKPPQTSEIKDIVPSRNGSPLRLPHNGRLAIRVPPLKSSKPSLWTIDSLFSSLHALDDIPAWNTTNPDSPPDVAPVVAATVRCIEALHALLVRAISPVSSASESPTPHEALDGIERVLPHILRTVVPTLHHAYIDSSSATRLQWHVGPTEDEPAHPYDTRSALDLVLGCVTTEILVPAIRALVPCTLAKTEHLLSPLRLESPKGDFADCAKLLSVVSMVLDALPAQQYIILYDCVALEAIRALTSLIADRSSGVPHARLTPAQRIHRIALKDALPFLCDAALLAFRRSGPAPPGTPEEMLRAALSEALGNLALTLPVHEGWNGLDIVEKHRVMAVLERAWSVGLRVGHVSGDVDGAKVDTTQHDLHELDGDVAMMDVGRADEAQDEDQPRDIISDI